MIKIKKVYDNEKEQFFKQKIDEVEKLKFEIFNQKAAQKEMQELSEIRQKVKGNSEIKKYFWRFSVCQILYGLLFQQKNLVKNIYV